MSFSAQNLESSSINLVMRAALRPGDVRPADAPDAPPLPVFVQLLGHMSGRLADLRIRPVEEESSHSESKTG